MGRITGKETKEQLPKKVLMLYDAVRELLEEEVDIRNMTVSEITQKAGIGKGTAYDYFETKEDIIAFAICFHIEQSIKDFEKKLMKQETFQKRLQFTLDEAAKTKACKHVMQYVNLLFDSGQVGKLLRSQMEPAAFEECPPLRLCMELVNEGVKSGELRDDLPVHYMVYVLLGKIVTYVAYLVKSQKKEIADAQFRQYIMDGIMGELQKRSYEGTGKKSE